MFGSILSTGLSLAGGLMGGKSKTKPYTTEQTPYWLKEFPEYKEGYKQLLADFIQNQYRKPYQPAYFMRRAEGRDSPYLQQKQADFDRLMQNPQPEAPAQEDNAAAMNAAAMKLAADAAGGRQLYRQSQTDPMFGYGVRGGRLGFQQMIDPDTATDKDFAVANRMWTMLPGEKAAMGTTTGRGTDTGRAAIERLVAGISQPNLANPYTKNMVDFYSNARTAQAG